MSHEEYNAIIQTLQEIKRYTLLGAKRVLNLDEVCLLTGHSKSRIYSLTSANKIPFYKSPEGRSLFFNRDEIEGWLMSRRNMTEDEMKQYAIDHVNHHPLKSRRAKTN